MSIGEWLATTSDALPCIIRARCATTLAPLAEKAPMEHDIETQKPRGILHLPFAQHTFEEVCRQYQIHGSILRTLTRSDMPAFSCDSVKMKGHIKDECFGKIVSKPSHESATKSLRVGSIQLSDTQLLGVRPSIICDSQPTKRTHVCYSVWKHVCSGARDT